MKGRLGQRKARQVFTPVTEQDHPGARTLSFQSLLPPAVILEPHSRVCLFLFLQARKS